MNEYAHEINLETSAVTDLQEALGCYKNPGQRSLRDRIGTNLTEAFIWADTKEGFRFWAKWHKAFTDSSHCPAPDKEDFVAALEKLVKDCRLGEGE